MTAQEEVEGHDLLRGRSTRDARQQRPEADRQNVRAFLDAENPKAATLFAAIDRLERRARADAALDRRKLVMDRAAQFATKALLEARYAQVRPGRPPAPP